MTGPKIAFIGAGSTVFMKNIVSDLLKRSALRDCHLALMDIDSERLGESSMVAKKLVAGQMSAARVTEHTNQREAVDGADFVIVAFQIGGYDPCTITDFEIPKACGLRQTIADTLGLGGIMRGLRTVPHLWSLCADMRELCPDALMLQYVNPMAINCWAIADLYPDVRTVGLCHSVPLTLDDIARDLELPTDRIRYKVAGVNHVAFFLTLEEVLANGKRRDLYPALHDGYAKGDIPKPSSWNPRCPNYVRYDVMTKLGYFVTESSEHFAEYVPWYIKRDRPDLIEKFQIPLDEYPQRCIEQVAEWKKQAEAYANAETIAIDDSHEYAADIINAAWTDDACRIYGNMRNNGCISSLPDQCIVEVPCLVDRMGVQPTHIGDIPPQLTALMRTQINVQELTVAALMKESRDHIYHAALMDPHTAAELDPDQIRSLVDDLLLAHKDWLPAWTQK